MKASKRLLSADAAVTTLDERIRLKRSMDDGLSTIDDPTTKKNKTVDDLLGGDDVVMVLEKSPLLGQGMYGMACLLKKDGATVAVAKITACGKIDLNFFFKSI